MVRKWSCCLAFTALLLASCTGSDEEDASVPGPDAAVDGGVPDAGPSDSGVVDAGPSTCDPIANSGCSAPQACMYDVLASRPGCRDVGAAGNGEACNPALIDCPGGFACFAVTGETEATCRKVCALSDGAGCEGLTGPAPSYACNLQLVGEDTFGFCTGCPVPCDPLASVCEAGEVCTFAGDCGVGCQPEGTVPLNGDCSSQACQAPGICARLNGGEATCYEPCSLAQPQCSTPNYTCANIGESFGLCAP